MTYEQEFLKDFSDWVDQQLDFQTRALKMAEKSTDPAAKEAAIRYESRLEAYDFLKGKFENYKNGRKFHDVPDLGIKKY